jgi:hypothetical protein
MGANSRQALGVALFLAAFVVLAAAMAARGSAVLLLIALVALAASAGIFMKVKPWEHQER